MAEFTKVIRNYKRMCNHFNNDCAICPIGISKNKSNNYCSNFKVLYPDEFEQMVMNWVKNNPEKTFLTDFKEKYPNAPLNEEGTPDICPDNLGYCEEIHVEFCNKQKNCVECWNKPLET